MVLRTHCPRVSGGPDGQVRATHVHVCVCVRARPWTCVRVCVCMCACCSLYFAHRELFLPFHLPALIPSGLGKAVFGKTNTDLPAREQKK